MNEHLLIGFSSTDKPEEKEMIEAFLHEAVLMKDFRHLNVLGIVGITFDPDGSPMVVLPFMANGDLRRYVMNADLVSAEPRARACG
jgi:serine/threonine protein kinase